MRRMTRVGTGFGVRVRYPAPGRRHAKCSPREPAAQVVLGLDIGTTSAKAVAFAPDGSALGDAGAGYPLHEPEPGRAEQDPGQVVDAAVRVLRDAAAAARDRGAEIAGVSISAAMHALVGARAATGARSRRS